MTKEEAIEIIDMFESIVEQHEIDGDMEKEKQALTMAIQALESQRWIPVRERLPEESGDYLVTTKWKGNYSGDVYIETNMAVYRKKSKEWDCVDVIAWMSLPEPYKESEDKE